MDRKEFVNNCKIHISKADKYEYEANCQGCIISDYDKYERHRNSTIMTMIGLLGLYFVIGLIVGVAIVLG